MTCTGIPRWKKIENDPSFLDTSGWISLLNSRESFHTKANRIWREIGLRNRLVYVNDWVVAETGNGLAGGWNRELFWMSLRVFLTSPDIRLIFVDGDLLLKARDLDEARQDKGWGLVDCASFVVMTEQGIRSALTADHHFDQAGFQRLLK